MDKTRSYILRTEREPDIQAELLKWLDGFRSKHSQVTTNPFDRIN